MPPLKPVPVGETFTFLTVLGVADRPKLGGKDPYWTCECRCGNRIETLSSSVRAGRAKSCGCYRRSVESAVTRHGHARPSADGRRAYGASPTYNTWQAMRRRCSDEALSCWPRYGGRGITVCRRWQESFDAFLADMGARPEGMTIDRIDPNGNYEPGNCRWATSRQQSVNKRRRVDRTSEHEGVAYKVGKASPWVAFYRPHGKFRSLGSYATESDAVAARQTFTALAVVIVQFAEGNRLKGGQR